MPCSCPWCVRVLSNLSVVLPGTAVAHGNGGTGRVLSDFLRTTRLATAEKGGGYVDYVSRRSRGDKYGTTHGSYVLPIYSAEGVVTHFAGASFSTVPGPGGGNSCGAHKSDEGLFIIFLVISLVLCVAMLLLGAACHTVRGKEQYCSLQSNLDEDDNTSRQEAMPMGRGVVVAAAYPGASRGSSDVEEKPDLQNLHPELL